APGAAEDAAGDDAGADADRDLDVDEVVGVRPRRRVLAEREHVDVVVDQHRDVGREPGGDQRRDVDAVPAGHDRRVHGATGRVLDGPRQAEPDGGDVGDRPADAVEQAASGVEHEVEHGVGAVGDVEVDGGRRQHAAGEVADRDG